MAKLNSYKALVGLAAAGSLVLAACSGDNTFGTALVASNSATGNVATSTLVVTADSNVTDGAKATIAVPAGSTLTDANGNTLDASSVTVTVQAFDGSSAAEQEFDGGVSITDPDFVSAVASALGDNVDSNRQARIDLAGFARINVVANGVPVKNFNPPLTVLIATPGLSPGADVAIISVDEITGERQFEGLGEVNSNREVVFTIDHLTVLGAVSKVDGFASGAQGGT